MYLKSRILLLVIILTCGLVLLTAAGCARNPSEVAAQASAVPAPSPKLIFSPLAAWRLGVLAVKPAPTRVYPARKIVGSGTHAEETLTAIQASKKLK